MDFSFLLLGEGFSRIYNQIVILTSPPITPPIAQPLEKYATFQGSI